MLAEASKLSVAASSPSRPLPLESGEFMHSREFLRRYERLPQVKKAELIEGVVYMGSPVSVPHAKPDNLIQLWLGAYSSRHPETEALTNATVILDPGEHCAARRPLAPPARTRRTHPRERRRLPCRPARIDCGSGASSDSIDLRDKRRAYCRNGVREYLVWLVAEARLEWFCLEDDDYRPQLPDA